MKMKCFPFLYHIKACPLRKSQISCLNFVINSNFRKVFRLDALALSVIATATSLAGWLGGWLSHSGIVSKPLNLSEHFFDHLKAPSLQFSQTPAPIQNSKGNPISGGVKCTGCVKIGDFRAILDVHRRLSRKRCEIGRWLLWNVNRKSWVPDWMG